MRAAIIAAYLDEDKQEYLRVEVEKVRQAPYEDSREYGRKFKAAVARAYTNAFQNYPHLEYWCFVYSNSL